jgi:transformation/transcription domain-associated protein
LSKIFEPRSQIKVKDVTEVNVDTILQETFTTTTILTDKKNADNQNISVCLSLSKLPLLQLDKKNTDNQNISVCLSYKNYHHYQPTPKKKREREKTLLDFVFGKKNIL